MATVFRQYPEVPVNVEPDVPHWTNLALRAIDKDMQAEEDRRTAADRSNLTTAREYADAKDADNRTAWAAADKSAAAAAKTYTDEKDAARREWAAAQDDSHLTAAEYYARTQDAEVLSDAKTYTDTEAGKDRTRLTTLEGTTVPKVLSDAKTYTDTEAGKDRTRLTTLEGTTVPKVLSDAKTYTDTEAGKDRTRLTTLEGTTVPKVLSDAKTYTDTASKKIKKGEQLVTGAHLDDYTAPGKYFLQLNENARPELGYPVEKAGVLDISHWNQGETTLMEQYWPYDYEGFFFRSVYYEKKTWKEIPTKAAVAQMIAAAVPKSPLPQSSRSQVVAIGDSLTDGYSSGTFWSAAEKWPTILDGLLPGASVLEYGMSGHTTDGTMLYIGALCPRFTVPGGKIPATGAVPVTTQEKMGMQAGVSVGGTLAGISGALTYTAGAWSFASHGAAAEKVTGAHEFIASRTGTWEESTAIIWLGRNDISNATTGMESTVPDHVVASTKKLVERLTPRVRNVMICGVTTRTGETAGTKQHAWVTEINDRLQYLFPEYFHSAQTYLREHALADLGITPTAEDTAKLAAGTVPPSLMDDETHISRATAAVMARRFFHPFLTGKGYVD